MRVRIARGAYNPPKKTPAKRLPPYILQSFAMEVSRCFVSLVSSTRAEVFKTTNMSVTCLGADPSTRIEPGGHINPVDPNLAPSLGPQGVFRAHL